jgi:hypothetical protein
MECHKAENMAQVVEVVEDQPVVLEQLVVDELAALAVVES